MIKTILLSFSIALSIATPYISYSDNSSKIPSEQANSNNYDTETPEEIITSLSDKIKRLSKGRMASDDYVNAFVKNNLAPRFDMEKISRYIMGRFWRILSNKEKKGIQAHFSRSMSSIFSKIIKNDQIDNIKIIGMTSNHTQKLIKTIIFLGNGRKLHVDYRVFKNKKDGRWYAYDILIENMSTLITNKKSVQSLISRIGVKKAVNKLILE